MNLKFSTNERGASRDAPLSGFKNKEVFPGGKGYTYFLLLTPVPFRVERKVNWIDYSIAGKRDGIGLYELILITITKSPLMLQK